MSPTRLYVPQLRASGSTDALSGDLTVTVRLPSNLKVDASVGEGDITVDGVLFDAEMCAECGTVRLRVEYDPNNMSADASDGPVKLAIVR